MSVGATEKQLIEGVTTESWAAHTVIVSFSTGLRSQLDHFRFPSWPGVPLSGTTGTRTQARAALLRVGGGPGRLYEEIRRWRSRASSLQVRPRIRQLLRRWTDATA